MALDDDIIGAKRRAEVSLFSIPGVIAVGVGPKFVGGKLGDVLAIIVTVQLKRPIERIPENERIPRQIDGFATDVVEGGQSRLIAPSATDPPTVDESAYPVMRAGIQIQGPIGGHGTLGCIARTTGLIQRYLLLTCQHVLHDGLDVDPGCAHSVGQPDGHSCCECMDGICGTVVAHERQPAVISADVDGAVAELVGNTQWLPEVQDEPASIPIADIHAISVSEIKPPQVYKVWKRGRTTRRTSGTVLQIDRTATVSAHGVQIRKYVAGIFVQPDTSTFVQPGDSGAPLLNIKNELVGIVFAEADVKTIHPPPEPDTTTAYGVASAITLITTELNVEIMTVKNTPAGVQTAPTSYPRPIGDFPTLPTNVALNEAAQPGDDALIRGGIAAIDSRRLATTLVAQQIAVAARRHREEIGRLSRSARVVAAWRRYGGAALIGRLRQATSAEEMVIPAGIDGRPFAECVQRFSAILKRCASATLCADAAPFAVHLQQAAGLGHRELLELLNRNVYAQ